MAEDDNDDDLECWIGLFNKGHGYAGIFNSDDNDAQRVVEKFTIGEWRNSMKAEFGIEMDEPQPNPNDPPDFSVAIKDQEFAVELVQLVEQEHKIRAAKGETPFAGQLFSDMQWSEERLLAKLHDVISKKEKKYRKAEVEIDVLLIHAAEPWLNSTEARKWIEGGTINKFPSIHSVFLLFEYEPSSGLDHWPVVPVYGELTK
ncbi:hypothetical protein [Neptunicoccus cionae]|uniref:Uncharacterized protein n=1 Tax=Neptunicoccus cionae TaxID=2035344 RepID=A0A916QZ77_9RHOB|nr:hypothetical protein [Amylibacter cionae]GGA22656.1 hypothetical protein GCM10011498_24300 [Amylibacter cionae]